MIKKTAKSKQHKYSNNKLRVLKLIHVRQKKINDEINSPQFTTGNGMIVNR